jgi:hypothetical protein
MQLLGDRFAIEERSLIDTVTDEDHVFVKINHRCWEEFTQIGLNEVGQKYIRGIDPIDWGCIESGFYQCLTTCIAQTARKLNKRRKSRSPRYLKNQRFSFGISLTGGNASFRDDFDGQGRDAKVIDKIYPKVILGTAAGLTGFFSALDNSAVSWSVMDGSAPKDLFWNGTFGSFISKILESSDAVLIVVPPWLSEIEIEGSNNTKLFKIIVPGELIDSKWALVVPVVLSKILELSRKHRLTVLAQCSVVAALLGMAVTSSLAKNDHKSPFRFYDLGQLLDLANFGGEETGFWLSRRDVREHADRTNDWSDLIWI